MSEKQEYINIEDVEEGFYFAKYQKYNWHVLIVEVYGKKPFLKLRAWHRMSDLIKEVDPSEVHSLIKINVPHE